MNASSKSILKMSQTYSMLCKSIHTRFVRGTFFDYSNLLSRSIYKDYLLLDVRQQVQVSLESLKSINV